jgi:hypothetical protein
MEDKVSRHRDIQMDVTEGEVLSVTAATDEATGEPLLVLSLRPDLNSGFKTINVAVSPANGVILSEQIQIALRDDTIKGRFKMPQSIRSLEAYDEYTEDNG